MTDDIFRAGRFEPDDWRPLADGEAVPAEGKVLIPFARYVAERDGFAGDNRPLGILIAPGEKIEDIAEDLDRFAVIAVSFPAYTDGRNYSTARLARERYGYKGEIRAVGNVLLDQVQLMWRCGIDALQVTNEPTRRRLAEGRVPGMPVFYQPADGAGEKPGSTTRSWLRRPG